MATVKVFDPAMCCSTGVCGTDVDPTLSTFAADLEWLTAQGVDVERATLSQEPAKFVATESVRNALETDGTEALPAVVVDGVLTSKGRYPTRAELAMWAGVKTAPLQMLPMASAPAAGGCCGGTGGC
ncbi:MAG TPA: arsenite efflux transporter metallochaperone ArsD [Cellulomonas sp.]|uniref:arsenite efflux transporter metallochaperone ArsD n=1 Tax=Cellulomonas sp. TaxID=40001 RepID=UPI002E30446D|nr:arsenite efflux transporter metallochaperone ArsD [Cellulomonas sp.]HEX5331244.1 arsenite efflux transporter metallochaperone ArsD [Cellulomonas sp.]